MFSNLPGHQQSGEALAKVLEIAVTGMMSPDCQDVPSLYEMRGNINFIIRPVMLKTTRRAAADIVTVYVELAGVSGARCVEGKSLAQKVALLSLPPVQG